MVLDALQSIGEGRIVRDDIHLESNNSAKEKNRDEDYLYCYLLDFDEHAE